MASYSNSSNNILNCTSAEGVSIGKSRNRRGGTSPPRKLSLQCKFGRRSFIVKLDNAEGHLATVADLSDAITKETNIPGLRQKLRFKGLLMDPPDLSGFSTLEDFQLHSGDQVLILNSCRIGTDDDEIKKLDGVLLKVKGTDKRLMQIFYELDKIQRGYPQHMVKDRVLSELRSRVIRLERDYLAHIEFANALNFDYMNAVDSARRRQLIDECQRQIDKLNDIASSISTRLALTNSSVDGLPVIRIPPDTGPCPHTGMVYRGPCH